MPALLRSRLTLLAVVASLGATLPACGSDEAVQNDAKDVQQEIDKGLGGVDEDAKDAAKDAADEIEQGLDDIDGN